MLIFKEPAGGRGEEAGTTQREQQCKSVSGNTGLGGQLRLPGRVSPGPSVEDELVR